MASRIVVNGRVAFRSRDWRPFKPTAPTKARDGTHVTPAAIPPELPASSYREGVPYRDPEDDVVYRLVERLDLQEGWGTADFWMSRWQVDFPTVQEFVARGWLDAAMERGSPTKRFRCRDEHKVLDFLGVNPTVVLSKATVNRRRRVRKAKV